MPRKKTSNDITELELLKTEFAKGKAALNLTDTVIDALKNNEELGQVNIRFADNTVADNNLDAYKGQDLAVKHLDIHVKDQGYLWYDAFNDEAADETLLHVKGMTNGVLITDKEGYGISSKEIAWKPFTTTEIVKERKTRTAKASKTAKTAAKDKILKAEPKTKTVTVKKDFEKDLIVKEFDQFSGYALGVDSATGEYTEGLIKYKDIVVNAIVK